MPLHACVIAGDGIGPEVIAAARRVLDASGAALEWLPIEVGEDAYANGGDALPEAALAAIRECGLALKGPVATRPEAPFGSVNVGLRDRLGLFLGVRPCRALAGVPGAPSGVDLAVLRMLDGDLYAGADYSADDPTAAAIRAAVTESGKLALGDDTAVGVKPISRADVERAAEGALRWMLATGRRRLTVVHKANVMRGTDGLFLAATRAAARDFPAVDLDDVLVDRACADLVRGPERFDVVFASMLYGDILSDLAAAVCGGLGIAPGANLGDGCAVFEPVHGTCEKYAGKERANPAAAILSGAMMLRHGGEGEAAARVEAAVARVVADGRRVTHDIARPGAPVATTGEMTEAIVAELSR